MNGQDRNVSGSVEAPNEDGPTFATPVTYGILPPQPELIEGCRSFTTSYFQLGFIPKALFLERLSCGEHEVSIFLLTAILAISARFTPALIKRYGSASNATSYFLRMAAEMVPKEMYDVSLERVQAFFLLSIAEWGNGDKERSIIHMGIAVRMATLLGLHREETYELPTTATSDEIVEAEIARRTFWMLQSQDNLHSGHKTPVSFSPSDITALLPCDEYDFSFGILPRTRASLPGTAPALGDPSSVYPPQRPLFATLIQAHNLWGIIARRASKSESIFPDLHTTPAEPGSEYQKLAEDLRSWEIKLPASHRWSVWNLRGYKAENLELAYLAIVMVVRLSNIVLRRIYLDDLIAASHSNFDFSLVSNAEFWRTMSHELFANVQELHDQIEAYFPLRLKEEGHPAILAFCVYVCGSVAAYLWRWPNLCTKVAAQAETMATRSLAVLSELQHAWPTASRWQQGLIQATTPISEDYPSPRLGREPLRASLINRSSATNQGDLQHSQRVGHEKASSERHGMHSISSKHDAGPTAMHSSSLYAGENGHLTSDAIGDFEAELEALLQGDSGFNGGWELSTIL
jgi:hypothetical protein